MPLNYTYPHQPQIIIIGGGTAGSAAAVSAARMGAKVLLVEEGNCLGGVSTQAGVSEFFSSTEGMGSIFEELLGLLDDFGAYHDRFYNAEYLKLAWQVLADRAGVDILFHTTLSDVKMNGNRIEAVELVSLSRKFWVACDVCIDASGEGDLAALAGAEFMLGHPENGLTLHMSLSATWYDTGEVVKMTLPEGIERIESEADLPGLRGPRRLDDGRMYANMTKIMRHDPTDPVSLSDAEREARIQLLRIVEFVHRTKLPTWALASSGATIGIREGRRIVGDLILTEAEVLAPDGVCDFDDGIAVATAQIDFHSLTQKGHVGWRQRVNPYAIPYRCCTPRGIDNLLTAGKCISLDQVVFSSYRMTPTVCMVGQAVGIAAVMSLAVDGDTRGIEIGALRAELLAQRLMLDPRQHQAFAPEITANRKDSM
ncbi:MAG: FAD-dependent oxidoreductase [Anaerolineaceae bacterium]|nr:FAD-dependent oxidoreductase [Anaerolineaceae bacterium]